MSSDQPHVWYYQKSGVLSVTDEGPYTDAQMMQLAKENKLSMKTPIRSPTRTKNQWISPESIRALAMAINQAKVEHEKKVAELRTQKQLAKEQAKLAKAAAAPKPVPEEISVDTLQEKIRSQVQGILTSGEKIELLISQSKPVMIKADAAVCTSRRLIVYRPKLLGRFDFTDYLWRDLADAHIKQGMIGTTFSAKHVSGAVVSIEWLPKEGAKRLYQFAQEREEAAFHTRRQMAMEETAAGAAKINVGVPVESKAGTKQEKETESPVKRLQALKEMLDAGLITAEEFNAKKQEILGSM